MPLRVVAPVREQPDERPELLVFPYNGNGLEALDCIGEAFRFVAFVDDTPQKQGRDRFGHAVLGRDALIEHGRARILAVPGGPASFRARRGVIEGLGLEAARFTRVVHPGAHVSPLAEIGTNVLLMAGVVVTSNAMIGNHVCVLPNSVIHHDVRIGDWTLVGANVTIAGGVAIGENCYIGSGSRIMQGLRIGSGALVGLGSNVIRDVAPMATVAGNPARPLARAAASRREA
jgi:sugar O-acyltransferase (sialic acid O-acetyltransferase NeuD family)